MVAWEVVLERDEGGRLVAIEVEDELESASNTATQFERVGSCDRP